jgi:ribosome maturation factor RimP
MIPRKGRFATIPTPHFEPVRGGRAAPIFFEVSMTKTSIDTTEKELHREVSRAVANALPGVEVLALELTGKERFCVYVDHPSGVDHVLCERVTGVLRPYLDRYSVEVSSPGSERPLRTRAHFERAVGRRVKGKTAERRFRGEVLSAGERSFRLAGPTGEPNDIPYDEIVRANLIEEEGVR